MATNSGAGSSHDCKNVNRLPKANDLQNVYQPEESFEPQNGNQPEESFVPQNGNQTKVTDKLLQDVEELIPSWIKDVNISMAFKEIVANDPNRHKELVDAVNKTFEETSESISPEEFQSMLGDLSFLKNKKNVANLYTTLQLQFNNRMGSSFEKIIVDENLSELFTEKTGLDEEEEKKYSVNDKFKEMIDLENTLYMLTKKVISLEEINEIFFNQTKFNKQRHEHLCTRVTKLLEECEVSYAGNEEQSEVIRKELVSMLAE